jgi:AraC-like DNA-binding protein
MSTAASILSPRSEPDAARVYDFETALPGGGRVRARRRVAWLGGGLAWVEEEREVEGRLGGPFVMGPAWMLEWHRLEEGSLTYGQDGTRMPVEAGAFALLFAPFSVTEVVFEDVRTRWVGIAGEGRLPGGQASDAVLFEVAPGPPPSDARALLDALERGRRDVRSIARCTRPSPHAEAAKAALDASYRQAPAIAALAARLGVSHPHLTRLFKRDYGMSPVAYRQALRTNEATAKLAQGDRIVDVSGDVGYEDLGRFYKAFRRVMNASPGQCRF